MRSHIIELTAYIYTLATAAQDELPKSVANAKQAIDNAIRYLEEIK